MAQPILQPRYTLTKIYDRQGLYTEDSTGAQEILVLEAKVMSAEAKSIDLKLTGLSSQQPAHEKKQTQQSGILTKPIVPSNGTSHGNEEQRVSVQTQQPLRSGFPAQKGKEVQR